MYSKLPLLNAFQLAIIVFFAGEGKKKKKKKALQRFVAN